MKKQQQANTSDQRETTLHPNHGASYMQPERRSLDKQSNIELVQTIGAALTVLLDRYTELDRTVANLRADLVVVAKERDSRLELLREKNQMVLDLQGQYSEMLKERDRLILVIQDKNAALQKLWNQEI